VEQIAAGEVVERPASVVKELVENAVDAGARRVEVGLARAGLDAITVDDDGEGIHANELSLAVERHATSKIDPHGPIDAIDTLGFRGEALAAIATVARLSIVSRPPGAADAAELRVVGGLAGAVRPAARAPGTTVRVESLFERTPARRKFLKTAVAEQLEIVRTVERLYLARPTIALRLVAEGTEAASYPAAGRLADAAARVFGPAILRQSFAVDAPLPGGAVHGVLGGPALAAGSSRRLFLAVNSRTVESRPLAQAVRAAFGDALPRTRYPVGVLHLELDPDRIDVNVHPTKREVRFVGDRELADALRSAVRSALTGASVLTEVPDRSGPARPSTGSGSSTSATARLPSARARSPQRTLVEGAPADRPPPVASTRERPTLELLGCVGALYWVARTGDELVLIDQHAASERLLYDSLLREGGLGRQQLVDPLVLRLSGAQRAALAVHAELVAAAGFTIEPFGPSDVRVRTVPDYRGRRARPEAVAELLDELADGGRPTLPDGLAERAAASIACHAAIRAGDPVAAEEFRRVLEALADLPEAARSCPHGRPIFVRLPRSRLDGWFLRTGS
jgi:DNA mismatch repair protein MutL